MNKLGELLVQGNYIRAMEASNTNIPGISVTRGIKKEKAEKLIREVTCEQGETCAICLNEFEDRERGSQLKCGHTFHRDCLHSWIENTGNCPSCRHNIKYL